MVIYTDMSTGISVTEPETDHGEEVRFANWAPQLELGLALQEAIPTTKFRRTAAPVLHRDRSRA